MRTQTHFSRLPRKISIVSATDKNKLSGRVESNWPRNNIFDLQNKSRVQNK